MKDKPLSPREQLFVDEYLTCLNGAEAARRAGFSPRNPRELARQQMAKPRIKAAIELGMAERAKRTKITQDMLLTRLYGVLEADVNGLVQYRRTCCRHCHGVRFRYQRTPGEIERDRAAWQRERDAWLIAGKPVPHHLVTFDMKGGSRYDKNKPPNLKCPECFGEGVGRIHVGDTRYLSPELRALYAGVHQGKDGLKMLTADKMKAQELAMRHLGMLNDKLELTKPKARIKDFTGRKKSTEDENT